MTARWITRCCIAVFVVALAGIIVTSIVNNNNGLVLALGGCISLAAVVMIAVSAVSSRQRVAVFADADAERLEARIAALIARGADESTVRTLVREAIRLGSR